MPASRPNGSVTCRSASHRRRARPTSSGCARGIACRRSSSCSSARWSHARTLPGCSRAVDQLSTLPLVVAGMDGWGDQTRSRDVECAAARIRPRRRPGRAVRSSDRVRLPERTGGVRSAGARSVRAGHGRRHEQRDLDRGGGGRRRGARRSVRRRRRSSTVSGARSPTSTRCRRAGAHVQRRCRGRPPPNARPTSTVSWRDDRRHRTPSREPRDTHPSTSPSTCCGACRATSEAPRSISSAS